MAKVNWKRVLNLFAFIGLCFVAFALLLGLILSKVGVSASIVTWIYNVGEWMAYLVTAFYAGMYVKSKRKAGWWIAYIAALVVVVILIILK